MGAKQSGGRSPRSNGSVVLTSMMFLVDSYRLDSACLGREQECGESPVSFDKTCWKLLRHCGNTVELTASPPMPPSGDDHFDVVFADEIGCGGEGFEAAKALPLSRRRQMW